MTITTASGTRSTLGSTSLTLPMKESLKPGDIEQEFIKAHKRRHGEPGDVVLDLTSCTYIDLTELCYAIAYFRARLDRGKSTRLRLPKDKRTRDFMRVWYFFEALSDCLGCPASTISSP